MVEQQQTSTPAPAEPVRKRRWIFLVAGVLLALATYPVVLLYEGLAGMAGEYATEQTLRELWFFRAAASVWAFAPGLIIGVAGGGTRTQVRRRAVIAAAITATPVLLIVATAIIYL